MASANFSAVAQQEIQQNNNNDYVNARYAPINRQRVGDWFPAFRQSAGQTFTDWTPSGSTESTWKKEYNLPTNDNFFRSAVTGDAIGLGNSQLQAWTTRSQTLSTHGSTMFCTQDSDCGAWPGTTCNANYEDWPDAKGNQSGSFCSTTVYPELMNGQYSRKLVNEGGIGRACSTDGDCGEGYSCNNEIDFNGKNVQQTGYCAQKYQCPDGKVRFLGTPYGSGIPQPPPYDQNNGGSGYGTKDECEANSSSQQNCVQGGQGGWYALFPGYCPVPANLREGSPQGNVMTSSPKNLRQGFTIPAYATNNASNFGSNQSVKAFTSWNMPSAVQDGSTEAWSYARSLDPMPGNYNKAN